MKHPKCTYSYFNRLIANMHLRGYRRLRCGEIIRKYDRYAENFRVMPGSVGTRVSLGSFIFRKWRGR